MEMELTIGKLTASKRTQSGKGVARKLRAQGMIPAVCYGGGKPSIPLTLNPVDLKKALDPGRRRNTVFELSVDDNGSVETFTVMLKDYQVDTLKDVLLHADFIQVSMDQLVDVAVPLELIGKPEGVKTGGTLHQVFRTLPVRCKPGSIPVSLSVDVSHLKVNDISTVKDVSLDEGLMIDLPDTQTIAIVMSPRKVDEIVAEGEGETSEAPIAEGEGKKEEAAPTS